MSTADTFEGRLRRLLAWRRERLARFRSASAPWAVVVREMGLVADAEGRLAAWAQADAARRETLLARWRGR